MNGAGIRYKYVEGSATTKGANFTRHALSLTGGFFYVVTLAIIDDRWQKKAWNTIFMPAERVTELYKYGIRSGAEPVDYENSTEDFVRALFDIETARIQQATLSPQPPTQG